MNVNNLESKRVEYLDSLRGLASISVVISHFVLAFRLDVQFKMIYFSPLHFFFDGFSAVTLFFILSGYVLTLSLERNNHLFLESFYLKRIFRIMPAYVMTLFLSAIAYYYFQKGIHVNNWATEFWNKPLDFLHFCRQVVFFSPNGNAELVPQNWSLKIEMLYSFLIPFLYFIYKKLGSLYFSFLVVILYLFFQLPVFIIHFSLGIFLALNQKRIVVFFQKIKVRYRIILILLILFLYTYRYTVPMYYYYIFRKQSVILNNENLIWIITGIGAFLVLLYSLSSNKLQKFLNFKAFVFIGRISYGIYLTHMIVLISIIPGVVVTLENLGFNNQYTILGIAFIVLLILTFLISYFLTRFVEIPMARIGGVFFKKQKVKTLDPSLLQS